MVDVNLRLLIHYLSIHDLSCCIIVLCLPRSKFIIIRIGVYSRTDGAQMCYNVRSSFGADPKRCCSLIHIILFLIWWLGILDYFCWLSY
eukprot:UN01703